MQIVRYGPQHRDALLDFLRRVFAAYPHKSGDAYFEWRFASNPLGSSLDNYLLLVDGDRIVGQIGSLRDRLRSGGEWHECVWIVDLVVDPAFRGGPAALRLFRHAMRGAPVVLATGVDAHILRIYEALGWTRLSVVRSRFAVLRPRPLLALASATAGVRPAAAMRLALAAADQMLPVAQRIGASARRFGTRGELHVEEVARFDATCDADLARLAERYDVTEFRSAALLNWKFTKRPVGRQQLLLLRSSVDGFRGMMVLKWMTRPGVARWIEIADYLVAPDDLVAFRRLAAEAVARADAHGFDFVRIRVSWPEHVRALRRPLWVDRTRPITDDVFLTSPDGRLLRALASSPWHLTALASDRVDTGRDEWPSRT